MKSDCEIILFALGRIDFDLPFLIGSVSIGKQSWESVDSVLKKKREATVGRICRKGKF